MLKHYRGEIRTPSMGVRALCLAYELALFMATVLLWPWKRHKLLVLAVRSLHLRDDVAAAVAYLREAADNAARSVDVVILNLSKVEFAANTKRSSQTRLALLQCAVSIGKNAECRYELALAHLLKGEEDLAGPLLMAAIRANPLYGMSHQNLAAKYDRERWSPEPLDLVGDPKLHLYDAYHLLGQLLVNIGDVQPGLRMFGKAMRLQQELGTRYPLPQALVEQVAACPGYRSDRPIRIVPYEWVTQIGHLGMLDALIKMSRLQLRPDVNWVLLAPDEKVVNQAFLACFAPHFVIVRDADLVARLFPYQRACGEQFNCHVKEDGEAVDWSDVAAQAFIEWDRQGRGPLIAPSQDVVDEGRVAMEALGLPRDAWFVALHARSSGFYGEGLGFIQTHRNAPLASYLPAIEWIVARGGWVVRMGDPSMPPLKSMEHVIDVAHSPRRSRKLDVYLWSNCRFFLGTTSGPTNAVISFHTPSLLVNCVSNYAQSWNARVVYVLKPFWSVPLRRFLTWREAFSPRLRASMFNARSMAAEGIEPRANSANDILVATQEMLDQVGPGGMAPPAASNPMHELGLPTWLWGNASPSRRFLNEHPELLGSPTRQADRLAESDGLRNF